MNKEEFRKHCEDQIERCIVLNDYRHLKEHEISLALLNECEARKQNQENLIKYIEDKIEEIKDECASYGHLIDKDIWYEFDLKISGYQDILERIKNNDWN